MQRIYAYDVIIICIYFFHDNLLLYKHETTNEICVYGKIVIVLIMYIM